MFKWPGRIFQVDESANAGSAISAIASIWINVLSCVSSSTPGIPGLKARLAGQGPLIAAEALTACVLMLPTHSRAGSKDVTNNRRFQG